MEDSLISDVDDKLWSKKEDTCPFTMKQLWTGESHEMIAEDSPLGYTRYTNRKCDKRNEVIGNEAGSKVANRSECSDLCNANSRCVSFEYKEKYEIVPDVKKEGLASCPSGDKYSISTEEGCKEAQVQLAIPGPIFYVYSGKSPCGCYLLNGWLQWYNPDFGSCRGLSTKEKDVYSVEFVCLKNSPDKLVGPCFLSSSCNHYELTEPTGFDSNETVDSDWYFKHATVIPQGYTKYENRTCGGYVPLPRTRTRTTQECANECSVTPDCVSFSMNIKTQSCLISTTCTDYADTEEDMSNTLKFARFNWYLKDKVNQGDEECLFLTYDKAKVSMNYQETLLFRNHLICIQSLVL